MWQQTLLRATHHVRGSNSLKLLRTIEAAPFAGRAEILSGQFKRLSWLLAQAEAHVPYYRDLFRKLGIHCYDIRTRQDFARLPVLTKDIIRDRLPELIRDDVNPKHLLTHFSGGSTGVPLKFYRDRFYADMCEAGLFRNFLQTGWKIGQMVAYFWGGNDRLYAMGPWEFELRQYLRRMYQFDPFDSGPEQMARWLTKWRQINPELVFGYASTVARFASYIERTQTQVRPMRGVFTTAEKLYGPQREIISRVFGSRVYDCYGSSEIGNIAVECPHGRMHINADFVVLESDRNDVAPGEPAPFLVTSLWNTTMPFIRYRNEDCGQLLDGVCTCGNKFPLIQLGITRISDNFVLPNGRVVHGEFFTHLMYGSDGIATFQFHQTAPDSITLWIVPSAGAAPARQAAIRNAVESIRQLDLRAGIKIHVRETGAIPLSKNGKHRFTRSDVHASTLPAQVV